MESSAIAYVQGHDEDGYVSTEDALYLFEDAVENPQECRRELSFALKPLARDRHPLPLEVLRSDVDLLRYAPYRWIRYLGAMVTNKKERKLVGDDWLIGQIRVQPDLDTAYRNLLLLQVAARISLSKDHGNKVLDIASADEGWAAPIRAWAALVWGASHDFKPKTAVERAEMLGDFTTKRAFALTLERTRHDSKMSIWRRQLWLANPELEPTVRWLEAA